MDSFLKTNKTLFTYSLILLIVIPFFGLNFLLSLIGNILLLIFLIPLLILIVILISFNSFKSKINTCKNCGAVLIYPNISCTNCGSSLENIDTSNKNINTKPSERTIEVKAEEI